MERITPIRITKNDRQEYARLARSTKAKIARTRKKYGVDLSKEIEIPSIDRLTHRDQFKEITEKMRDITNPHNQKYQYQKNQYGVVATKSELFHIKKDTKNAQLLAERLIKDAEKKPFISGGKKQGTLGEHMEMSKLKAGGIHIPKDFNFSRIKTRKELEFKRENMEQRSKRKTFEKRMERMRDNFISRLERSLNSHVDALAERLRNMPPDDFYEMYLIYREFDFDDWDSEGQFTGSEEEASGHVSQMHQYIDQYERGDMNMDLKGTRFRRGGK